MLDSVPRMRRERQSSIKVADLVAHSACEKNAEHIVIMDMSKVSGICDFFVICSTSSAIRSKTVAENIESKMKQSGLPLLHREGLQDGRWILLDFGGIVAHIFQEEARKYYSLETLWGDAPRRFWSQTPAGARGR